MRQYIKYRDIKKEYRDNYYIYTLVSYHNVLAHLERRYDRNGDYDPEDEKEIQHLEKLMLEWAMVIENLADTVGELKGKLIKNCLHDHVYVDLELKALLKPVRTRGIFIGISDKIGRSIYTNDVVKTQHGRICLVVQTRTDSFVGFDLLPYDHLECPPPDDDVCWKSENLEVVNKEYPFVNLEDNNLDIGHE